MHQNCAILRSRGGDLCRSPRTDNFVRSEKLQNESSPNFSNFRPEFCPEFCSEFSPNFSGSFRASFRGKRRPEKIHQKSPPFSIQNSQANTRKIFTKCFWRVGKMKFWRCVFYLLKMARQTRTAKTRGSGGSGLFRHRRSCMSGVLQLVEMAAGPHSRFSSSYREKLSHRLERAKRETAKGRNQTRNAHFRRFLQIFADFRLAL